MFALGDIFEIRPPTVDHKKYCICLGANDFGFNVCLFLNSKNNFHGDLAFKCADFPMLQPSDTGVTVVSLSTPMQWDERRLALFQAKHLGELPHAAAELIIEFCNLRRAVKLSGAEKSFIVSRLKQYLGI